MRFRVALPGRSNAFAHGVLQMVRTPGINKAWYGGPGLGCYFFFNSASTVNSESCRTVISLDQF